MYRMLTQVGLLRVSAFRTVKATPDRTFGLVAVCHRANSSTLHTAAAIYSGRGQTLPPLITHMSSFNPPKTLEETLEVVRIPPTGRNVGPRVEHIEVTDDGQLSSVISTALQLPTWFALELLRFGAVHYSPIMPHPAAAVRPLMSQEHLKHVEQLIAEGRAKLGRNPKLQHPKRVLQDLPVSAGGYVRVHVHPKRFPAAYSVDWKQQILADLPECVVVNKPPGVQVPPTVDNILESVVYLTADALGLPEPHTALLNTHRLDAGTSGVVVLAKNSKFANWFSSLLKNKAENVVKVYKCLTSRPPPVGRMMHYATVRNRTPGEPAHTRMRRSPAAKAEQQTLAAATAGSAALEAAVRDSDSTVTELPEEERGVYCELIVLEGCEVQLTGTAATEWGATAFESTLQLVTGRTHQIRAQMAAEGLPLLGDQLYQALADMWQKEEQQLQQQHDHLHCLQNQSLEPQQRQQQTPQHSSFTGADWSRTYQEDPLRPIGLQAHVLSIRDMDGRMTGSSSQHQQQAVSCGQKYIDSNVPDVGTLKPNNHDRQLLGADATAQEGTASADTGDGWLQFCAGTPWWRL